jgi:hypothetical protein
MLHFHAVVWIDHAEARIYSFNDEDAQSWTVRPDHPLRHIHHKAGSIGAGHAQADHAWLHEIAEQLKDAGEVLLTGPGTAKAELARHLQEHDPEVAAKVVAVEALDHPSEGQLLAFARQYFRAADRMMPQR